MKAMLGLLAFLFVLSAVAPGVAAAQQAAAPANPLPATYVSAADIQANMTAAPNSATNPLPNIRVVDAGGYNVAVGVIHRPQTPPGVARRRRRAFQSDGNLSCDGWRGNAGDRGHDGQCEDETC
jgi:hypothetical protein